MKNFSKFSSMFEELTTKQKRIVDDWLEQERLPSPEMGSEKYDPTRNPNLAVSHHIFGDKTEIEIPLLHMDDVKATVPHDTIKKHLEDNGFAVSDYKKGLAKDKYGREVRIGRVLERTKAPESIKKEFVNDQSRAATKKSDMSITITRHPYEVAGMSTNRGWKSCLSMPDDKPSKGGNFDYTTEVEDDDQKRINWKIYLPEEVTGGTHVAYLGGTKNPVARIALRQYREINPKTGLLGNHTVLRPDKVYGTANDRFHSTMMKWSEDNYPLKSKTAYELDPMVYAEEGNARIHQPGKHFVRPAMNKRYLYENTDETLTHFANSMSINPEVQKIGREIVAGHPGRLKPELIDSILSHRMEYAKTPVNPEGTDEAIRLLTKRREFTDEHARKVLDMNHPVLTKIIRRHRNPST